jgi:transcriptional regulator with XRE-family HTH domain
MVPIEDIDAALAQRLRIEREARGWSMADVAARSGVSKAMVSKIERGETSASAALLAKLAAAFDLTLAGLLLRLEQRRGRVSRAGDRPRWTDPETGYQRIQVLALAEHPIEIVEIELPAGRRVAFPASTYAFIRQAVWVRDGVLTVSEGPDHYRLQPGDCLAFGLPSDVTLANETARPCSYAVVLCRQ